jgi:DNA-binding LytR/AlgR family response regulator
MSRKFCLLNCDPTEAKKILQFFGEFLELECTGLTETYDESVNLVLKSLPEIVIIDIDKVMGKPTETAFSLINEIFQYLEYFPTVIAVSSSTDKAYDTIKLGFSDYLLKPLSELDIRRCVLRLKKSFKDTPQKICLKSYSDYRFIDLNEILYLQADNNNTDFILRNNRKVAAYKPLKYYNAILPKYFLRVHASYVVNTKFLVRINFSKSNLTLSGENKNIPFSRSHKKEIEILKKTVFAYNSVEV